MRRRRLAFPTGKVARPLAVTDESQNAAYFLQPNWNGSIVHLTAHKQSRFQLARLAARATLPAREGKCALRAQDAHLYKSQFAEVSLVEGPSGSCTLCPTSVTHLLRALPANSQFSLTQSNAAAFQTVKKASQSSLRQQRKSFKSFSTAACTWAKTLLRLQVWNLFAYGEQIMRAADCKTGGKARRGFSTSSNPPTTVGGLFEYQILTQERSISESLCTPHICMVSASSARSLSA